MSLFTRRNNWYIIISKSYNICKGGEFHGDQKYYKDNTNQKQSGCT